MSFTLDFSSRGIAFAIGISVLLHGLVLWVPNIELPQFKAPLPPLEAKLVALPGTPAKSKTNRHARLAPKPKPRASLPPQPAPAEDIPLPASSVADASTAAAESSVAAASSVADSSTAAAESSVAAASSVADSNTVAAASLVADSSTVAAASSVIDAATVSAASAPLPTETLAQSGPDRVDERPALPLRAQLTFDVYKGSSEFRIGKVVHTLERDGGHYVLQSVTETVGLAKLLKTYKLTQYSSGSYSRLGLQPEHFFEERTESVGTQRNTLEFDYASQRVRFSHGGVAELPPDTQDMLSILYQFPPLAHARTVAIFVGNSRKIERYEFEIADSENIHTTMGELRAVHLRKLHKPNDEGLEIWLALEYRLFPVKMRIIDRNGEIAGESIITDIRAEFKEGIEQNANY